MQCAAAKRLSCGQTDRRRAGRPTESLVPLENARVTSLCSQRRVARSTSCFQHRAAPLECGDLSLLSLWSWRNGRRSIDLRPLTAAKKKAATSRRTPKRQVYRSQTPPLPIGSTASRCRDLRKPRRLRSPSTTVGTRCSRTVQPTRVRPSSLPSIWRLPAVAVKSGNPRADARAVVADGQPHEDGFRFKSVLQASPRIELPR